MIPKIDPLYVPFGPYDDCMAILDSKLYYPCLLTGPSGIGKTVCIEQICAQRSLDYYRVNITYQTDESDLIGGMSLVDGNTIFEKGPVIKAMEAGGILLLDEIDLASPMLVMCLQSILEGKGYLIKKTSEWIEAKDGFQIFATANTKGLGDSTGSFVGTQVLNEAFLERFPATIECTYPPEDIEKKILTNLTKYYSIENNAFVDALLKFAAVVRESYLNDRIEYTISTRRLCHIIASYSIWKDVTKAMTMCLSRFDTHTKNGFMDIFELNYENERSKEEDGNATFDMAPWEPWA